jgi:ribosomal protein uL13
MRIINGEGLIVGRALSQVAKVALLGEQIEVINCEKFMITGDKRSILTRQRQLSKMKNDPRKGRFYYTRPESYIRRIVRGMLPRSYRGIVALKRVRCHAGVPIELKNAQHETIESASIGKVGNLKYISVGDICKQMGGKW